MSHDCEMNSWINRFRIDYLVLILICTAIRILHIDTFDLWGDEIYNFFHVNTFFLSVRKTPLYIMVNLIYKALLPESSLYLHNFVPRIPALMFGILTVLTLYDGFKRFLGNTPAWIVAILSCTAYPLIIYSRESRFYSMTHFFVAASLWFFLAILKDPTRKRMIGLTVTAVLGFLTYPYLTFSIFFMYLILFIHMSSIDKRADRKFFLLSFLVYAAISGAFLILMRKSFSSGAYAPLGYSFPFFVYALKSAVSYFSGNSYLITAIAFIFPLRNIFLALKGKEPLNYIYLWWMLCFSLVIAHIFIITFLTVNAFNPRHISFLTIPFLAAVTLGAREILEIASQRLPRKETFVKVVFIVCILSVSLWARDFRYYLTTGRNYHAVNRQDIGQTMHLVEKATRSCRNYLLFYVKNGPDSDYLFYHYRSGRRIVDWKKHDDIIKNVKPSDAMCLGFLIFYTDADKRNGEPLAEVRKDMDTYSNGDTKVFITKKEVQGKDIQDYVSIYNKLRNR